MKAYPALNPVATMKTQTTLLLASLQSMQQRYQPMIDRTMRETLDRVYAASGKDELDAYYGQMRYHLGWVDVSLAPVKGNTGKMLRSMLLLLAYEAAGAWGVACTAQGDVTHLQRALPAAMAIELAHNSTLIHDDIEDGDTQRRHRPTLWKCRGVPQAINTGDGMFALSRLVLWNTLDNGVESRRVARLGMTFDRTAQIIAEGQYLDLSLETCQDVSVALYLEMIRRKTAALMSCATEMGALLGTQDQTTVELLHTFGQAIGIAFQVRDDILGVWASSAELGKTAAGDLSRRKKSLPVLHALEQASEQDQRVLRMFYQQEVVMTQEQVDTIFEIFECTQTRNYCSTFLAEQCRLAYEALAHIPYDGHPIRKYAIDNLEILIHFVEQIGL
jgi:geranylgeranyl diphosphate synthase, type I